MLVARSWVLILALLAGAGSGCSRSAAPSPPSPPEPPGVITGLIAMDEPPESKRLDLGRAAAPAATLAPGAHGRVLRVGPSRELRSLKQVAALVEPGDLVLVDGAATYEGDVVFDRPGAPAAKIVIRGVPKDGRLPKIVGIEVGVELRGDHYVLEGFDISGASRRCVFHHAHDITLRDSVVHHCRTHGILGADDDSGSLTLEGVEVFACGGGDRHHCIYMATDESAHPGAVFRMQQSFVHDTLGGNAVKSRAERNEIYYNWIEGALYHELELIGPDGQDPGLAREDSDVVGNVFVKRNPFYVVRIGGDGTGQTDGRYRFVNNTFVVRPGGSSVFRLFHGLQSVEMHNNAFIMLGDGAVNVLREQQTRWSEGRRIIAGSANWVSAGAVNVPEEWQETRYGPEPGVRDLNAFDLRPRPGSPLAGAASAQTLALGAYAIPRPLLLPERQPPRPNGSRFERSTPRPRHGKLAIGAFELDRHPTRQ